jgi:hypothetical protein
MSQRSHRHTGDRADPQKIRAKPLPWSAMLHLL